MICLNYCFWLLDFSCSILKVSIQEKVKTNYANFEKGAVKQKIYFRFDMGGKKVFLIKIKLPSAPKMVNGIVLSATKRNT